MAKKSFTIGARPSTRNTPDSVDAFVSQHRERERQAAPPEPMRRLTIDIRESLHRALKVQCVTQGVTIADVVRDMLEERFMAPPQSQPHD